MRSRVRFFILSNKTAKENVPPRSNTARVDSVDPQKPSGFFSNAARRVFGRELQPNVSSGDSSLNSIGMQRKRPLSRPPVKTSQKSVNDRLKLFWDKVHTDLYQNNNTLLEADQETIGDPNNFGEYARDIQEFMYKSQTDTFPCGDFMKDQKQVNYTMRYMLINWMIEVHYKFKLDEQTLFITIGILDRFLEKGQVNKDTFQMYGAAAMLIASKYEDIYPPEVSVFVKTSDHSFTKEALLAAEEHILKVLNYKVTFPTAYDFMWRYCKLFNVDATGRALALYIIELGFYEHNTNLWKPSELAAASIFLSCRLLNYTFDWTLFHEQMTHFDKNNMRVCAKQLTKFLAIPANNHNQAAKKKFQTDKFFNVAAICKQALANQTQDSSMNANTSTAMSIDK